MTERILWGAVLLALAAAWLQFKPARLPWNQPLKLFGEGVGAAVGFFTSISLLVQKYGSFLGAITMRHVLGYSWRIIVGVFSTFLVYAVLHSTRDYDTSILVSLLVMLSAGLVGRSLAVGLATNELMIGFARKLDAIGSRVGLATEFTSEGRKLLDQAQGHFLAKAVIEGVFSSIQALMGLWNLLQLVGWVR